jgi:HAD superfamily hydrolase (TIGR01509 family)
VLEAAILDIDGTLVDSNYQHALAWDRAFAEHGSPVPVWRIHRHIGMGGDQLVVALAGDDVEAEKGDDIRDSESAFYGELIDEVRVFDGARELILKLENRGVKVVLASSAKPHEAERYVEMLNAGDVAEGWTTSGDVEETKPHPDLVDAALEKASTREAVMIGDSTWDIKAAERAGIETVAVLSGGFGEDELREAGARAVYESVAEIADDLDSVLAR